MQPDLNNPSPSESHGGPEARKALRSFGTDTHARTIVKSLTWRIGGFAMTMGVAWAVTGKAETAASIGLLDTLVKLLAFYLHERAWFRIPFGRARPPDYEI